MSEEHIPTPETGAEINTSGWSPDDEKISADTPDTSADDQAPVGRARQRPEPTRRSDEWKRNFNSVFGQGIGRVSLGSAIVVVLILMAIGIRQLTSSAKEQPGNDTSQVEVPEAPEAPIAVKPISPQEAARRNNVSAQEAVQAKQAGNSYQPAFMPNIGAGGQEDPRRTNLFPNSPQFTPPQNMPVANSTGTDAERKLLEEARKHREQALADARKNRDEFVSKKRELVMAELNKMLKGDSLNKIGTYNTTAYAIPVAAKASDGGSPAVAGQGTQGITQQKRTPVIRTGNVLYAETTSKINTDDGTDAMAVLRGGAWDGSKLIGKVENKPNNIGVRFTTLAPQDGRPAMAINAVALRTEDASQGIAEDIDHHTLERYAALGFSSLLSGYGKAYSQSSGTTVIAPSGTAVTTTEEPSSKRVLATSLGELGTNASQEIQKGFNRPTTYSTPAGQGLAVYFLADVYAPEN